MDQWTDAEITRIAEACHEVNRRYCEFLGDGSQVAWAQAPQWQRESAEAGVRTKLTDPETTSEKMHQNWCERKRAEGWSYGAEKNVEARKHPCMVPYDELPADQRVKDTLFSAVCVQVALAMRDARSDATVERRP